MAKPAKENRASIFCYDGEDFPTLVFEEDEFEEAKKYDPNQPRAPKGTPTGGQWTDGETLAPHFDLDKPRPASEFDDEVQRVAEETATRLGFPLDKMTIVRDQYPTFKIGDEDYTTAGLAHQDGTIELFPRNIGRLESVSEITAHEIMHQRYRRYMNMVDAETKEVMALMDKPENRLSGGRSAVMNMDGTLKFPYNVKFPAYESFQQYGSKTDQLIAEDGVTPYSTARWNFYKATFSWPAFKSAVNETLAEMAAQLDKTGILPGTELWRNFYRAVAKVRPYD